MKRWSILTLAAVFILVSIYVNVFAANWLGPDVNLTAKSYDGARTTLTLKDGQNRIFKVTYQDEALAGKLAAKIIKYKDEFFSWRLIRFKDINFVISPSFLEIVAVPVELMHNNLNLAGAIPAGITMTYYPDKDILRYDFRIMKDNLLIRISGNYRNEDEMVAKLAYAYDNPSIYLRRDDPESLLQEIEELRDKLEKLRQALIFLNNEDWIGRLRTIPQETIFKISELKQKNPKLTRSELWKQLQKQKIKITKQELELILIVYFNEF